MDTTESAVAEVNVALGSDYRLVRQLPGGLQSSAYELTGAGTRVVLKWSDDPGWAPRVRRAQRANSSVGPGTAGYDCAGRLLELLSAS